MVSGGGQNSQSPLLALQVSIADSALVLHRADFIRFVLVCAFFRLPHLLP